MVVVAREDLLTSESSPSCIRDLVNEKPESRTCSHPTSWLAISGTICGRDYRSTLLLL